ncbi:hypothetical protein Peur_024303 [Populus x canadensis]
MHLAAKALDIFDFTESTDIARFIKDFDRAKMAMHSGDGFWFISDPLQRLLHPLLHRKPSKLALQDIK